MPIGDETFGIAGRLKRIKYQELKNNSVLPVYSDTERIEAVQSLYDAAINVDTLDLESVSLPTQIMGVDLNWTTGNTVVTLESGNKVIANDDLTDDIVPDVDDTEINPLAFEFDGEIFQLRTGEDFELRSA